MDGRCGGTTVSSPPACRIAGSRVPEGLEARVRAAGLSRRFVLVSRDPQILVYLGEHGDYVVVDGCYCSCEGYLRRTSRESPGWCTHVYAVGLALESGRYRDVSRLLGPEELAGILWETLTGGIAVGLRRLLARLGDDVGHDDGYREGGGD